MSKITKLLIFCITLIAAGSLIAGCQAEPVTVEVTRQVEVTREVKVTELVEVLVTPEPGPPSPETPFEALWASSAHAAADTEAFRHWDGDDPKVVPAACARCHTPDGFEDYVGADGSAFGAVDAENYPPTDLGITCTACHNDATVNLTTVIMPSGIELTGLGDESRCMTCHQGRESKVSVDAAIEKAAVGPDEVSADLGFKNIHYFAAAATKYGTVAKGGYEYEGMSYDGFFAHVDGFTTCIGCHDPHTLQLKIDQCQACHTDVEDIEDFKNVRMNGSLVDYDGDGDLQEGIYYEIEGLQAALMQALQAYAAETAGAPIVYSPDAYPYFFIDTDGNGELTEDEATSANRYASWTPRLLEAAYNYQVSIKDPGAFAHGGKYILELLYDSTNDLRPEMVAGLRRIDDGHFAGSEEAFRHWDADGAVPGSCSRCHSAGGLPLFLTQGVTINQPVANGFQCATCHNDIPAFTRYENPSVTFPSGAKIDSGNPDTNLCMTCHQGRESGASVDRLIAGLEPNTVSDKLRFINVHYFAAGATRFGGEARGAYQYEGKEYAGQFLHVPKAVNCTDCHSTHQLEVKVELCSNCHDGVETRADLAKIRIPETPDYDGDGDTTEGMLGEVETMHAALLAALQAYVAQTPGLDPIIYNAHAYPYFFIDANDNGVADPDETGRYVTWTPNLLKAAYTYQYVAKDPGGFAHNGKYILQVLYDGIENLGGDVSAMTRP